MKWKYFTTRVYIANLIYVGVYGVNYLVAALKCSGSILILLFSAISAGNSFQVVQDSHIEGNVPAADVFEDYLARDLSGYFSDQYDIRYKHLREGPTQIGVAAPKYYLWVVLVKESKIEKEGAVKLAAVGKQKFEVTHFVSKDEIKLSPDRLNLIFPRLLIDRITELAMGK